MLRRKCEKCGRKLREHKVKITSIPITSNPEIPVVMRNEKIYYCEKCENFRTDLKE